MDFLKCLPEALQKIFDQSKWLRKTTIFLNNLLYLVQNDFPIFKKFTALPALKSQG